MKKAPLLAIVALLVAITGLYLVSYHGPRSFSAAARLPNSQSVVSHARSLKGVPYDMLQGKFSDIGAKLGLIVCSDVPNIAYGRAGYSLRAMLERDVQIHPERYGSSADNDISSPFFHRRARNLYTFFKANNRLFSPDTQPRIGDLAFYRNTPAGNISHVTLVTQTTGNGYSVMESAPETVFARELNGAAPIKRGLLLAGFGRMY